MAIKVGNYSSWTVLSQEVVQKHCDKSAHIHGLTIIDTRIREYWGAEKLDYKDNRVMHVTLLFEGNEVKATIDMSKQKQTRIYFTPAIKKYLEPIDYLTNEVTLEFRKKSHDTYAVIVTREAMSISPDDRNSIEEVPNPKYPDGKERRIYTTVYERNPKNRAAAIKENGGYKCAVCGMDFVKKYGKVGESFIEVHHKKPLASLRERVKIDPKEDLVCLCSNCHSMIHRKEGGGVFEPKELAKMLRKDCIDCIN